MAEAWVEPILLELECKGCGVTFQQHHHSQSYHDVPCRLDATDRTQRAQALERPKWKASELECRGCGVVFLPQSPVQSYHDVPCRLDATDRTQRAKALERPKWKASKRECRGCGVVFLPQNPVQRYHDIPCRRVAAFRRRPPHKSVRRTKDEIAREIALAETLEKKKLAEKDQCMREDAEVAEFTWCVRRAKPLMALAEKEALAKGYEFEVIPDGHPRWAHPSDLWRSSAMNRIGLRRLRQQCGD